MGKKSFKESVNPALQFMTIPESEAETTAPNTGTPSAAPEGYKVNPLYVEKRTKRVQLVMQPSIYERTKTEADRLGLSFNEYVHKALEKALNETED